MIPRLHEVQTVTQRFAELAALMGRSDADLTEEERNARDQFTAFCHHMEPEYIEGEHLIELRWALSEVEAGRITRLIITMPPRHSKSLHVSENFPAWYLGRHPSHRVISASHTQKLADRFSRSVRRKVNSQRYPFPELRIARDNAGIRDWSLEGYPTGGYVCVGVGGAPTGVGGNIIIIDDPIRNQADADSETIRETVWEWFTGTMYTRRQPGAAIIVTATRWHEDDLTGRLLAAEAEGGEKWYHLYMPAINDEGEYLWPEFYKPLDYQLAQMTNNKVWNAQYMGRPFDEDGNLMMRDWFGYAPMGDRYLAIVQAWDTASKPGVSNDYSVGVTIGISATNYDILDVWEGKPIFPDLEDAVKDRYTWAKNIWPNLPISIVVEDANSGIQLIQNLHRTTNLPVIASPVPPGKDPKQQRVIGLTPLMRAKRVRVLSQQMWINRVMRQLVSFPNGANDDIVDAVMIGLVYATGIGNMATVTSRKYGTPKPEEQETPRQVRRQKVGRPRD